MRMFVRREGRASPGRRLPARAAVVILAAASLAVSPSSTALASGTGGTHKLTRPIPNSLSAQRGSEVAQLVAAGRGAPLMRSLSCSGTGCNNQDPAASGCAADAVTVLQHWVHAQQNPSDLMGTIELRWSPSCQTNWARVWVDRQVDYLSASIIDQFGYPEYDSFFYDVANTSVWSQMLYAPVDPVDANTLIEPFDNYSYYGIGNAYNPGWCPSVDYCPYP